MCWFIYSIYYIFTRCAFSAGHTDGSDAESTQKYECEVIVMRGEESQTKIHHNTRIKPGWNEEATENEEWEKA